MRVFLCSFGNFSLAIPLDGISSVTLVTEAQERPVWYNDERGNRYLSLPLLFNLPLESVKHGIILKRSGNDYSADDYTAENRNVLLTTEINCETEIPEEQIYSVPEVLKPKRFMSGILFACAKTFNKAAGASKTDMVLFVNPALLFESAGKEL